MALTFSQLTTPKTDTEWRAQLLAQLQGIGFTRHTGYSPGSVTLTGTPNAVYYIKLKIIAAGSLSSGTFQYSTDDGITYSSTHTIPSDGVYVIPGTGVSTLFSDGPTGTGDSFVVDDVFSIDVAPSSLSVTSWQTGSTALTLVENNAEAMADQSILVQKIGSGGLLLEAKGDWLDLWGTNVYKFPRNKGIATQGTVTLTDSGGAGPFSITNNQLWAISATGLRFNSVGTGTLTLSGSLSLTFQAESPGSIYNVANDSITTLVTTLPGVTLSNPDLGGGTWITLSGTNDETDDQYVIRCQDRWPAIGTGTTNQVFDLWAKTADTTVTRTMIQPSISVAGRIEVFLAGAAGPVSGGVVTTVDDYIQPRLSLTTTAVTASASGVATTVTATIYVAAAYYTQSQADCSQNLQALFNGGTNTIVELLPGIDIGSTTTVVKVYVNQIIEQLQIVKGVRNVVVAAPASDVTLTAGQVATLTQNLTFISI